jgi:hypothetical protein
LRKILTYCFLEVVTKGGNDRADRLADASESEAGDKGGNGRSELDEKGRAIGTDDSDKIVNGLSEVLGEFAYRAGAGNNLTNGRANGKTETRDKSSSLGAELEKEALSVGAGDLEDILNLRSKILNNLVALQVVAKSGDNGANRGPNGGETKARKETRKASGELDEKVLATLTDDGKKVLSVRAEALDKLTNRARTGDDGADGAAQSRETKAR